MSRYILFFAVILVISVSCKNEKKTEVRDKKYGGTININISSVPLSLSPWSISDIPSIQVVSQIHTGLVRYNSKNLAIMPSIARKWSVDEGNTVYTFYLRSNAFFHDNSCFSTGKGRAITAADVKFSLTQLCINNPENKNFNLVSNIVGAKKVFDSGAKDASNINLDGISVVNDSVVTIKIEKPNPYFVNYLASSACAIVPREAVEKYGSKNLVGAGPFIANEEIKENQPLQLTRFENYFLKDDAKLNYPYIDTLNIYFINSSKKELSMFFEKKLNILVGVNNSEIPSLMEKHIKDFESKPPKYILSSSVDDSVKVYNLLYPEINDFYTNSMNFIDFTSVYITK